MVELTYKRPDEPIQVGEYYGDPIWLVGTWRAERDGLAVLMPHTTFHKHDPPPDLDADPDFRALLLEKAEREMQHRIEAELT